MVHCDVAAVHHVHGAGDHHCPSCQAYGASVRGPSAAASVPSVASSGDSSGSSFAASFGGSSAASAASWLLGVVSR